MDKKGVDKSDESNTIVYTISWNEVKSARLKRIRGVSFEELITDGNVIALIESPVRPGQHMFIVDYKKYIGLDPCVIEGEDVFLKTLYPSRKYHKFYKKGVSDEKV
ncbi:MAG TPA: toxin [Candidatus Omnitrophota bacterium]|nr:toxin [Candidatus Omnitrophota bacterium]HNQ50391.1 toxin [Candidatus Omnitrophota bacterium]